MASPTDIIGDAFKKLQRSISEEDAYNFASTELKDIWTTVREIDTSQRKRQSAQNIRRINPLLQGLEKYRKVIEVLCNGTPYMPYVWAPIKLMLEISSRHRDVFEALLTAYADIGAVLPRLDRYNNAFHDNLEFQHALAAVYAGILEFHQRAYKFFRRRAWHVIFLSLWKDFGGRFDNIITSLKKQRDFIDVEAASLDIVEAKESRLRIHNEFQIHQKQALEVLDENEKQSKISRMQHSVTWLCFDGKFQEAEYERLSERRHDKTCVWVTTEDNFKNWMKDDSKRSSLWLDGKPGSGKSVMCSYLIQKLTATPGLTVCYYFCNNNDTGNIINQILMNIVLQILQQHTDVSALIANEYAYCGLTCGMAQLRNLVPKLLQVSGYTRIIVDGIDECSKENQKSILKELQSVGVTTNCKIMFSSRKEVHIRDKLSKQPRISLDGRQEVDQDIRTFIKHKISKLSTSNRALLDRIELILVGKANGMFLWVRLVVDELKDCYSDAAIEETATHLPKGLKAAYGRILDRIMDSTNSRNARYMAIRILGWMACAYRTLKTYELLDGIAFEASSTTLNSKTKIRKNVLDLCRPLIEEGPGGTTDFVHFSAKEYILEEEYQARRPFIWYENAHLDISFSCIAFLNSSMVLLPVNSTDSQRAEIVVRGFHGLQVYADKFWHKHLKSYCDYIHQNNRQLSPELRNQLTFLLQYKKIAGDSSSTLCQLGTDDILHPPGLSVLNDIPNVKSLVLEVLEFRAKMDVADSSDQTPEAFSLQMCDTDPTHFSQIRISYQQTIESLLHNDALAKFPQLEAGDLQCFRETYGLSAFLCRYPRCDSNSDGFNSFARRAQHESQHQRRFRCSHSSCIYFAKGFTTRSILKKHNEKWHAKIADGPSLIHSLQLPKSPPKLADSVSQRNTSLSPDSATFPQNHNQEGPQSPAHQRAYHPVRNMAHHESFEDPASSHSPLPMPNSPDSLYQEVLGIGNFSLNNPQRTPSSYPGSSSTNLRDVFKVPPEFSELILQHERMPGTDFQGEAIIPQEQNPSPRITKRQKPSPGITKRQKSFSSIIPPPSEQDQAPRRIITQDTPSTSVPFPGIVELLVRDFTPVIPQKNNVITSNGEKPDISNFQIYLDTIDMKFSSHDNFHRPPSIGGVDAPPSPPNPIIEPISTAPGNEQGEIPPEYSTWTAAETLELPLGTKYPSTVDRFQLPSMREFGIQPYTIQTPPSPIHHSMWDDEVKRVEQTSPSLPRTRQFTLQEIQNARNHPSGKLAAASDNQIRFILNTAWRLDNKEIQTPTLNQQRQSPVTAQETANARPQTQSPAYREMMEKYATYNTF